MASLVSDTNATFTRISYETAISLSRGVTDSQASLADLTMQVSDQAVRSGETLIQATNGLTGAVTQIGNARAENERLFGLSNSAVSNSLDEGRDFRDDNFHHAALAAIESIEKIEREELLNRLQFVLALLGAIPGPIGIGFNLLNAEISKARGNAEAARDYTIYAIPFVGGVYGLGQLGVMLGQYTASKLSSAISAQPGDQTPTQLPVIHRINWVSGPGGGNSFVAGTGVVTGVDENGNLITTAIEDLQVGDVVLAGNELDPTDPTSYELVTATSHRTVHELTEVTYVDDQGNIDVIKATDNHEFYVEGIGWVKAAALQQGNLLRLADGRTATVTSTATLAVPEGVEVYNLSVTDGKTYFVDDGQGHVAAAWVHNISIRIGKVTTYKEFIKRSVKNDKISGHEILQNAWLAANGFIKKRLQGISRNNIVLAVSSTKHTQINRLQAQRGLHKPDVLQKMSRVQNIRQNLQILRDVGISEAKVQQVRRVVLMFARSLK